MHIEFGTSRSHKKLLGKKRRRDLPSDSSAADASAAATDAEGRSAKRKKGAARVDATVPADGPVQTSATRASTHSSSTAAAPTPQLIANKGRFSGTLAARMLGGGT